jgi:hypothetical protein
MASSPYVPDILSLLSQRVQKFATNLTDDKGQQKEIMNMWNDTIRSPRAPHNLRPCATYVSSSLDAIKNPVPIVTKQGNNLVEKAGIIAIKTLSGHMVNPATRLVFDSKRLVIGKEINEKNRTAHHG